MAIKHSFASPKPDDADTTLIRPSNWNANHTVEPHSITKEMLVDGIIIEGIVSNPGSGEYRITGIRLDANKKIVITYEQTPEP